MGNRAHKLFMLFVVLLHIEAIESSSVVGNLNVMCLGKERQALLKFRQGLVQNRNQLSSWVNVEDCCRWEGVGCSNKTGHVIKLDLHSKFQFDEEHLRGEISPSLLELQHLRFLDLSYNFYGHIRIPKFIGSFPKLRYLNLSNADFGGAVPPQLGNASTLRSLNIGDNFVYPTLTVDNLEWLSRLSSLRYLDMSNVNLSKAVDWVQAINMLPHLSELHLKGCELAKVPSLPVDIISNMPVASFGNSEKHINDSTFSWLFNVSDSLMHLDLSSNNFGGGISRILGNICKIHGLDLSSNNLEGEMLEFFRNSARCIGDLPLESLNLYGNQLSGHLPNFTRFSSLRELYLGMNQLNGTLPKSLGQLSRLIVLDLSSNSLDGFVSEALLCNLSSLKELYLDSNSLVLNLSSAWFPTSQYTTIGMSSCKLGTRFPKWLHTQKNLIYLDISNAGISDTIPDWFWGLTPNLVYLNLSNNQINGQVPHLSLKFIHLSIIDLSTNQLEGPLPQFSSEVQILDISKNSFSGSLSSLCKMKAANWSLTYLDLSMNHLSGGLPDCWMYWKILMVLNLNDNNVSGKIPRSMGSLTSLEALHLRNNNLSGELPLSIQNCKELISLDLGKNKLSGKLPPWIGESLSKLKFLYLRSNEFDGHIPLQLCHLTSLQVLDLSLNNISGSIPKCLSNFSAITQIEEDLSHVIYVYSESYVEKGWLVWKGKEVEYTNILRLVKRIDLSSNNLFGEIPIEITNLFGLQGLNLSRNHLTGSLPVMIGGMCRLESLDLSINRLSGVIPPTLSNLTFLSHLDLSYNELSGKIPLSTQLQSFNASSYAGNHALCGPPLEVNCSQGQSSKGPSLGGVNNEDGFKIPCFYISFGLGFFIGFLGICGTLLLNDSLKYSYFKLFNDMKVGSS